MTPLSSVPRVEESATPEAPAPKPSPRAVRIPALDGLRAISIAMVVVSHLSGTRGFPSLAPILKYTGDIGVLGVRVFFVISGFLITTLLIDEQARTGRISMRDFYVRRAIRILPALLTFLAGIRLAEHLGWVKLFARDWPHALTFTMNYHPHRAYEVGHLWSLSVEEQFYLLWPAVIAVAGLARAIRASAFVVVLCPLLRVVIYRLWPTYGDDFIGESFETVADSIAVGCLLAALRPRLFELRVYRAVLSSRAMILVPFVVLFAHSQHDHPYPHMLIGESVVNIGIAMLIDWCVRNPTGGIGRLLDGRAARFIGVRSYSLYLWQNPFLNHYVVGWATAFPANILISIAAALFSYDFVERPMLKLRARFAK